MKTKPDPINQRMIEIWVMKHKEIIRSQEVNLDY